MLRVATSLVRDRDEAVLVHADTNSFHFGENRYEWQFDFAVDHFELEPDNLSLKNVVQVIHRAQVSEKHLIGSFSRKE